MTTWNQQTIIAGWNQVIIVITWKSTVQIEPLVFKAVYAKSTGHFDPLIGRAVVWMVFIRTTFLFEVRVAETRSRDQGAFWHFDYLEYAQKSKVHFEPLIFKSIMLTCLKVVVVVATTTKIKCSFWALENQWAKFTHWKNWYEHDVPIPLWLLL